MNDAADVQADSRLVSAPASPQVVTRFRAAATNCYTGSLAQVASQHGHEVTEPMILERGDGFLFRCGHDEWGLPEYTFPVEEVGLRGMARLGYKIQTEPIDPSRWLEQLKGLVEQYSGVVVWVNSSHLAYADIYANSAGYLHAVLILEVSAARARVYDSLVVDRKPYGCVAWMDVAPLGLALSDRVATETYDHMGAFHVLTAFTPASPVPAGYDLRRQSETFLAEPRYRCAIQQYRQLCLDSFSGANETARRSARRLFDHINTLYVVPNQHLMYSSLERIGRSREALARCRALIDHWRALALMALKYEATLAPRVQDRIDARFASIDAANTALWHAVVDATKGSVDGRGVAESGES